MKTLLFIFIFAMTSVMAEAQESITQTVRGTIADKDTRTLLPGANIIVLNSDPLIGTSTDINGNFRLDKIPVGRIGLKISYMGFRDVVLNGLYLSSGKELVLNIEMEEKAFQGKEVVISSSRNKAKAINEMTTVSSRGFTVEESERYAGSRNDVARMASNYAGVRGTDDSRNDIIIRGNSPSGLLWRLEGVDIPNPNHYGATESTGGPVSILNNNLMANSDFMTGAFPAEYGNALSGVFDLKMRNGNNEKHEFLGQIGFNGFELGTEGPVNKKNGSSYLVNYRYSTLEVFELLGVDFGTGTAIPKYQDISFKVNLPRTKVGSFSVFGVGGISSISFLASERDTSENPIDFYAGEGFDLVNRSNMAVLGVSHTLRWNQSTYSKFIAAETYHNFSVNMDSISPENKQILPYFGNSHQEQNLFLSFYVNRKINSRHNFRVGINSSLLHYQFADSIFNDDLNRFDMLTKFDGKTQLVQPYFEWQFKINNQLTMNSGIHYQQFMYNNSNSFEPRLGLRWNFNPNQSLGIAYGYHSQLAPITVYFNQTRQADGSYLHPNKNLDMTHSQHFVLGYDWGINEFLRLKTEAYYQYISNAGVDGNSNNSYSVLNQGANFYIWTPDTLSNAGVGNNYGLEFTLEKFLSKGMYYLATLSLYESKFIGSDGVERNSAFNGNFVLNGLMGKEWVLGRDPEKKRKKQLVLLADLKVSYAGGQRYTPLHALQTGAHNYVAVYEWDKAYSKQFDAYSRTDLRIALKQNSKKISMEWAIDIQNLFNTKNVFSQKFNTKTGETEYTYQIGLLVIPQFKIVF